jgi:hypothetical protein
MSVNLIDDERLEKALRFLATTDDQCAALRADMERTEFKAKAVKAAQFKLSEGSVADRNATADTSEETSRAYEEHFKAMHAYHSLANRRSTEAIVIDTWRSMNANRRLAQ